MMQLFIHTPASSSEHSSRSEFTVFQTSLIGQVTGKPASGSFAGLAWLVIDRNSNPA